MNVLCKCDRDPDNDLDCDLDRNPDHFAPNKWNITPTHTWSISISSSSVESCRYGLLLAGRNLYPVTTKKKNVATSLNNSCSQV